MRILILLVLVSVLLVQCVALSAKKLEAESMREKNEAFWVMLHQHRLQQNSRAEQFGATQ